MQSAEVEEAFPLGQSYNVREALMLYLKAIGVGVLVGLLSAVLWVVGILYWAKIYVLDIHLSVNAGPMLLVALVGFVVGFLWTVQRARATN